MKTRIVPRLVVSSLIAVVAFLFCGDLQDPWADPDNATLREDRCLTNLPAKVNLYQEYPCSLYIMLPALADSVAVVAPNSMGDTVLWRLGPLTAADSAIGLSLVFYPGTASPVTVLLYRRNGNVDSLVKPLLFKSPPTIVQPASRSIYVNRDTTVAFTISDPDGDIHSCYLWIDSTTGQAIVPPLNRTGLEATVSILVSGPSFDTMIVLAQAWDSTGNSSALARCTVFVMDTGLPRLSLLRITPSINDSIVNKLPCSLLVKIRDDSPIDSAAYALNPLVTRPMTMINDTVALAIIADLDSGANSYEAQAWDKAGNLGTLRVPILYTGSTVYRFTFRNISDKTINENGTFPSINLDSTITLDPPPVGVPNWKANVIWQILETKPDSGIRPTLNPTTRVVTFAVPDSEWNGSESFTFIASLNDFATGYAGVIYKVNPINDAPVITWKTVIKAVRSAFDTIYADKCVIDPDNPSGSIAWVQDTTRGKIYTLQWISNLRMIKSAAVSPPIETGMFIIDFWTRKWNVVVKNPKLVFLVGSTYIDTLRMIARDPLGAADTQEVIIRATY
jgi:hypothetical protein